MTHTDTATVRQILTAHGIDTDQPRYATEVIDVHLTAAHSLVERELDPYTDDDLALTEAYIAASYAADSTGSETGSGAVSSLKQGSRQVSFDTDDLSGVAQTIWTKALREDPTGRLGMLDNPTATISVPSVRGQGIR